MASKLSTDPIAIAVDAATSGVRAVSGRWLAPRRARALYVIGHGAGSGMDHPMLASLAAALAARAIATLRYQFPYRERGRKLPDRTAVLTATVRAAVTAARERAPSLPIAAGGRSMGGRMTSLAQAEAPLPGVGGLVFLGFPLHRPAEPATERADHLAAIRIPMLFVQGDRDDLAALDLLRPVCRRLARLATLHVVDHADHGFEVLRRSGRTPADVLAEVTDTIATWIERRLAS